VSRFVVVFESRNGSSHLAALLNSHPAVLCYPEVLVGLSADDQMRIVERITAGEDPRDINSYAGADRYYPGGFAAKFASGPFPVIGFKTKATDMLRAPDILLALRRHGYRLVYLQRDNVLKAVVSHLNLLRLQQRHGVSNAERPEQATGPLRVDLARFRHFLERRELCESLTEWFYEHHDGPKTRMVYEDMLADEDGFMARLLAFVGAPPARLSSGFYKNTPPTLRDAIENYDAFREAFAGTAYARHLDP
jgi:hypothetical protein